MSRFSAVSMLSRLSILSLLAVGASTGCGGAKRAPGDGVALPSGEIFSRQALLSSVGACIYSHAQTFDADAKRLATNVAALVAAPTDASARTTAQTAWRTAMATWQRLETMTIGPHAMRSLAGGQELRQSIYAWPTFNRCKIEQTIVEQKYLQPSLLTGTADVRTLLAVEYLLFFVGTENGCAATDAINTSGSWAALTSEELAARRLAYAKILVDEVAKQANTLVAAWDPAQGNFLAELANAGQGSRTYRNAHFALNAVSDAMFFIESDLKDMKIAPPAGVTICKTETCPESLESQFAGASKAHARANLEGFADLFVGCGVAHAGIGFDDNLYAVGAESLSTEIVARFTEAKTAFEAIPGEDLAAALTTNLAEVRAFHTALREVTILLRSQFISVLDLEIPRRVEGDND